MKIERGHRRYRKPDPFFVNLTIDPGEAIVVSLLLGIGRHQWWIEVAR